MDRIRPRDILDRAFPLSDEQSEAERTRADSSSMKQVLAANEALDRALDALREGRTSDFFDPQTGNYIQVYEYQGAISYMVDGVQIIREVNQLFVSQDDLIY